MPNCTGGSETFDVFLDKLLATGMDVKLVNVDVDRDVRVVLPDPFQLGAGFVEPAQHGEGVGVRQTR